MSEPIFREKSLQKVKSPDNLNEYIRVANPSVWIILAAVIILLAGFCIWSVFGTIQTVVHGDARCEEGSITCFVSDADAQRLSVGMSVQLGSYTGTVTEISVRSDGGSSCIITSEQDVPDGVYEAEITLEKLHAASFLLK